MSDVRCCMSRALGLSSNTRSAPRTGSPAQVSLISGAAAADPAAEQHLVDLAATSSLGELREEVSRVKAAQVDREARRADIRARRSMRSWTDTEGEWQLRAHGNPEDGAQVMAALAPIIDRLFHAARRAGRREPAAAYAFDALVTLAVADSSGQPVALASSSEASGKRRRRRGGPRSRARASGTSSRQAIPVIPGTNDERPSTGGARVRVTEGT